MLALDDGTCTTYLEHTSLGKTAINVNNEGRREVGLYGKVQAKMGDANEDPGEDVALLSVSFEDTEATQVFPKLYLSPRIEQGRRIYRSRGLRAEGPVPSISRQLQIPLAKPLPNGEQLPVNVNHSVFGCGHRFFFKSYVESRMGTE
ncbi:BRISC and BRCA1-A complex member 2 [Varanus komodoensis]|nr:BRISC and BRCA1-A complex member 2 [Varanus komodoensis]